MEKITYSNEHEIDNQNNLIVKISKMDVCPVCKNKITEAHVHSISKETSEKIESLKKEIDKADENLGDITHRKKMIKEEIENITSEISKRETDFMIMSKIEDKKNQIKESAGKNRILEQRNRQKSEKKKSSLGKQVDADSDIEKRYEELSLRVQDIPLIDEEDLGSEITFKQREIERIKSSLRQLVGNEEELKGEISDFKNSIERKKYCS